MTRVSWNITHKSDIIQKSNDNTDIKCYTNIKYYTDIQYYTIIQWQYIHLMTIQILNVIQ